MDGAGAASVSSSPRPASGLRWVAALLLAMSLGLPWGERQHFEGRQMIVGYINLWNSYAGSYCCLEPMPVYDSGGRLRSEVVVGAGHPARFGLVAAIALLAFGGRRAPLWAAGVLACQLLLSGSQGFTAGGVAAAWLAVLLLVGQAGLFKRAGR